MVGAHEIRPEAVRRSLKRSGTLAALARYTDASFTKGEF